MYFENVIRLFWSNQPWETWEKEKVLNIMCPLRDIIVNTRIKLIFQWKHLYVHEAAKDTVNLKGKQCDCGERHCRPADYDSKISLWAKCKHFTRFKYQRSKISKISMSLTTGVLGIVDVRTTGLAWLARHFPFHFKAISSFCSAKIKSVKVEK